MLLMILSAAASWAQIDRTFVCPESLPSDNARMAALRLFDEQVIALEPRSTVASVSAYRYRLLVKHRCVVTLRNIRENAE